MIYFTLLVALAAIRQYWRWRAERRAAQDMARRIVPRGHRLVVPNPADEALTREMLRAAAWEAQSQVELDRQRLYRKFERGISI